MASMKALTLTQPWATLVALGLKRIETRSWATSYRGLLAIHAAQRFPKEARAFTVDPVCYEAVRLASGSNPLVTGYPLGVVLATCRLVDCVHTEEFNRNRVLRLYGWDSETAFEMNERERLFGNYEPGRWAWLLTDVKRLAAPIPAKGALG